jgi:hypothetical protein
MAAYRGGDALVRVEGALRPMSPEEIANVLAAYTRALGRATMRSATLPSTVATEIAMELEGGAFGAGEADALRRTVEALRRAVRTHPAD